MQGSSSPAAVSAEVWSRRMPIALGRPSHGRVDLAIQGKFTGTDISAISEWAGAGRRDDASGMVAGEDCRCNPVF